MGRVNNVKQGRISRTKNTFGGRQLAKLVKQMKKQKNKARNQRLFRLKRPNVVYQSNIPGVYVDIKEAVENEKSRKK